MENENNFGKGGVRDFPDTRDYQYSEIAGVSLPFDWDKGFDIEEKVGKLPVKDQGGTSACGGFAWATYSYVLDETNREEKSEKFIYAQTHVQGGGSAGRDNCNLCIKKGVCAKTLCPLPNPLIEAEITRTDDITAEAYKDALTNKEKSYLLVNTDIESVAEAMRDNNGVILGVTGQNNGTWSTAYPQPPVRGEWNHWLFCGKSRVVNGKKYIGVLNSWGERVGENGWQYLSEDYFKAANGGFIWSAWTMAYNSDLVKNYIFSKTLRLGSTGFEVKMLQTKLGITADGIFGKKTLQAVKDFQTAHQLVPDGIVGRLTNNVLNSI